MAIPTISLPRFRALFVISMLLMILIGTPSDSAAQSAQDSQNYAAARSDNTPKPAKGILNPLFKWMANEDRGILMGTIQSIDTEKKTIKVLNQDILIDDETVFLGTLKSIADLKTKRAVVVTTQLIDNKLNALEVYRLPKPKKKAK